MNLPKIQNGRLQILNQRGIFIRSHSTPNVVFADIKPDDSQILVTYENGKVDLLNALRVRKNNSFCKCRKRSFYRQ